MSKKIHTSILLTLIVTLLFVSQNKPSYSLEEEPPIIEKLNLDLEYTTDKNKLMNDIHKFIDTIDDTLIPIYEYVEEINLNDNYQLLTRFSLNFILNNQKYYKKDIINGDSYQGIDIYGNKYTTNKYVSLNLIYNITYSIFNRRYYHITNQELTIENSLVPLIGENYPIEMNIEKILNITKKENNLLVNVKYKEFDFYYQYEFEINNQKITLKNLNIEV